MSNPATAPKLAPQDVLRLCGDILDWKIKAIIETGANWADVATAMALLDGGDDDAIEGRRMLSAPAGQVYDLLNADADFAEAD